MQLQPQACFALHTNRAHKTTGLLLAYIMPYRTSPAEQSFVFAATKAVGIFFPVSKRDNERESSHFKILGGVGWGEGESHLWFF